MKYISILALCLVSSTLLFAQKSTGTSTITKHRKVISQLLQQHPEHSVLRTTAGVSTDRVIAQCTRDSMGVISDSVSLNYGTNMTSAYDFNTMIYPYNYPYSTSPMFNFAGVFTRPQVLFDTCLHFTQSPFTLVYGLYEATVAGYDASKNMVTFKDVFVDSVINTNMSYVNSFNAANNIEAGYWFHLSGGVPDSVFKQFFTYNTAGLLTKDSIYEYHLGSWHLVAKALYTYNADSNLTQIDYFANDTDTSFTQPLQEKEQYINTYDASHRLLTVLTNMYNGSTLEGYVKDTFAYTGTHSFHTSWKEHQYDPINTYWAPMFYMHKTLNGAGYPDTVNIYGFDSLLNSWIPAMMDVVHYNSFNLPDTLHEYDYNFTSFPSTPSYNTVYYYETYLNTTSAQTVQASEQISIYPNPAKNTITISQHSGQRSMAEIALVNVNGQVVSAQRVRGQREAQLSVKDILPGIYWIFVSDDAGNILHRQAIMKQ